MKIAFLNIYQNTVDRGAETFVSELSKRLGKNHGVDILSGRKLLPQRRPILWRLFIDPQSLFIAWFTLKKLPQVWREKYDIIIPLNGGWQPAFIRLITWLYGGKMVIAGQSGMGWDDRNNLWSFPNYFIALSSKALRWAKKANPLVRSKYIPNGVDLKKFNPLGSKYKTKLKKPIILCVGALTSSKRIDLTIKAVVKLKDVSLLVVGDGSTESELKSSGKKLLGKRFELIKASFKKMPEIYRVADIFTLVPEGSEAFGIVYAEALATNLPIVAIDDEQRKEIAGDAGMFVDPTDIEEYSKKLNMTLKKEWGDKPRKQAEKFDWDKVAQKYEDLFISLIKK
jgi:glycosyltransferase involved in cell wall biosynthesis